MEMKFDGVLNCNSQTIPYIINSVGILHSFRLIFNVTSVEANRHPLLGQKMVVRPGLTNTRHSSRSGGQ